MSRFLHRTLFTDPVMAVRGEGIYLYTADGKKIIDGSGGAAVACLGHGNARVNAAIAEQLSKVAYVHTALFTNPVAEELAEIILDGSPGGLSHAWFCSSGSEPTRPRSSLRGSIFWNRASRSAPSLSRAGRAITAPRSARCRPAAT